MVIVLKLYTVNFDLSIGSDCWFIPVNF